MARPRMPRPGSDVIVHWIDSGASGEACPVPSQQGARLFVKRTHGRVISCAPDESLPDTVPNKTTLVLAMCSGGKEDDRSELAAIWAPAILEIQEA